MTLDHIFHTIVMCADCPGSSCSTRSTGPRAANVWEKASSIAGARVPMTCGDRREIRPRRAEDRHSKVCVRVSRLRYNQAFVVESCAYFGRSGALGSVAPALVCQWVGCCESLFPSLHVIIMLQFVHECVHGSDMLCCATLCFHWRIAEAWPRQLPPCTQVRRTPFPTCWGTFRLTVVGLMDRQTYASTPVIKRRKRRLKSQPCHEGAVMWCHLYVVHLRSDRDSRRTRAGRWPRFGSLVRYFR